jgi:hypothetical protein
MVFPVDAYQSIGANQVWTAGCIIANAFSSVWFVASTSRLADDGGTFTIG